MLERRIDDLNARFLAAVQPHADLLGAYFDRDSPVLGEVRDARMYSIGDRLPVPPPLVPKEITARLAGLHRAFRFGLRHVFENRMGGSWSRLADELRLDWPVHRYLHGARLPTWARIGRPDVVIAGDHITMVEPNVGTSCGGMPDADVVGRLFEQAPIIGEYLHRVRAVRRDAVRPVARLIEQQLAQLDRPSDELVVVLERAAELADPAYYHCTMLARELRRHGVRAEPAAAEDLQVGAGAVSYAGKRVGVVYRMCGEQPDPVGFYPALSPILDAARRGVVSMVDDLSDQIAGNKTIFVVLSEELDAGHLPSSAHVALASFVPWSRILDDRKTTVDGRTVNLPSFCAAERENLVLKPGSGFQGRGVTIGEEVTAAEWHAALQAALESDEPWLVQRLIRTAPTRVAISRSSTLVSEETFVDYGYYAVGGTIAVAGIRKSAPFGAPSRKIKPPVFAPMFFV